jgi:hypothetical protein
MKLVSGRFSTLVADCDVNGCSLNVAWMPTLARLNFWKLSEVCMQISDTSTANSTVATWRFPGDSWRVHGYGSWR